MMWVTMDLSEEALVLSMLVKVVDNIDDKKNHDFLETPLAAHPLLGWELFWGEWLKFPAVNHDDSIQRK